MDIKIFIWRVISEDEKLIDGGIVIANSEDEAMMIVSEHYDPSKIALCIDEIKYELEDSQYISLLDKVKDDTKYWNGRTPNDY